MVKEKLMLILFKLFLKIEENIFKTILRVQNYPNVKATP